MVRGLDVMHVRDGKQVRKTVRINKKGKPDRNAGMLGPKPARPAATGVRAGRGGAFGLNGTIQIAQAMGPQMAQPVPAGYKGPVYAIGGAALPRNRKGQFVSRAQGSGASYTMTKSRCGAGYRRDKNDKTKCNKK